MNKNSFISLLVTILLLSCGNPFEGEKKKLYHKRIEINDGEIQWYKYSLMTNTTPDYVEVIHGDSSEIICRSASILDVDFINGNIVVKFGDSEELYHYVQLPSQVFQIPVIKDTSEVGKRFIKVGDQYFLRKDFKPSDTLK